MKKLCFVGVLIMGLFLMAGSAFADSKDLIVNATVASTAKLTITGGPISFADADPDVTNPIPSSPASVSISAKVKTGSSSNPTLKCLAGGDLTGGSETIPIANVTWTAANPCKAGTMDKTTAQSVDNTWTGSGNRSCSLSFFLANSWDLPSSTSNFTATVTYTLTAP